MNITKKTNSIRTTFEEIKQGVVFCPISEAVYYIKFSSYYGCNALHLKTGLLSYFEPEEEVMTGPAEFIVDF